MPSAESPHRVSPIPVSCLPAIGPHDLGGRSNLRGNEVGARRQENGRYYLHWRDLPETKIKVSGLHPSSSTLDVHSIFAGEGKIERIELLLDFQDLPTGSAFVIFSPPPRREFWKGGTYRNAKDNSLLRVKRVDSRMPSFYVGTKTHRRYPEVISLTADLLQFGILYEAETMKPLYDVVPLENMPISARQNLYYRQLEVEFAVRFQGPSSRDWIYRFMIPYTSPMTIFETRYADNGSNLAALVISVEHPPEFSRKYADERSHREGATQWRAHDSWYRAVDILDNVQQAKQMPACLRNDVSVVNLGRWTAYRLVFSLSKNNEALYHRFLDALCDFNIEVCRCSDFRIMEAGITSVFEYLDNPAGPRNEQTSYSDELLNSKTYHLPFEVRYQLEVCISEGCLNEYNLSQDFVQRLIALDRQRATELLAEVAAGKKRIFNPMSIFNKVRVKKSRRQIPSYCFYAHAVTVTPTTLYVGTPSLEVSNRVIRQYSQHADRFLRVRFTEERHKGRIFSSDQATMNEVFTRVKRVLMNGIVVGGRHYEFLAFGNSQLREHGAYFFCPLPHLTPARIRQWMGNFEDIKIVAKYAARLGQCFSTTRAIHGARATICELEDVMTRDGRYMFTDGVGIISKFLAQVAASEIGVLTPNGDPPSAMQFRLGGCKGVLVVWTVAQKRDIHIRKSQYKFDADHEGLEIIRWSQFAAAHLNRQLITILTTLGVEDYVFTQKLDQQLAELSLAMVNPAVAVKMLQREVDPNQMTIEVAQMVNNHFQAAEEPFMVSILRLWRAFSIKYLKEKARILIEEGAQLLGCVDETGKLQGHFDHLQSKVREEHDLDSLPQIFVQISVGGGPSGCHARVIEGVVLLARNPSLHPGDVRVVRAVDVPELHHLKDVVVLPKTGDRDLASMCSGGDLDGDDFLVFWDKDLMPREWNHEPMDYSPPPPLTVPRTVTVDDITSFFTRYIKNDSLGTIANAHLATADASAEHAKDARCLELVTLHSIAVDYAKTGHEARMPLRLKPKRWPHFMNHQRGTYRSTTALGKLYDQVELVDFVPAYENPFDRRILDAYRHEEDALEEAASIKEEYDEAVRKVMAQHDIKTEFEVWSTFVLQHDNQVNGYKFHEEIGRLSAAIKDAAREKCYKHVGGREPEKIAPFVAAMYKVTSLQVNHVLQTHSERPIPWSAMPMVSFPWVFASILGDIATGRIGQRAGSQAAVSAANAAPRWQKQAQAAQEEIWPEPEDDVLETRTGPKHRGDVLSLFNDAGAKPAQAEDVIQLNANKSLSEGTWAGEETVARASGADGVHTGENGSGFEEWEEDREVEVVRLAAKPISLLEQLAKLHYE